MSTKLLSIVAEELLPQNTYRKSFIIQNEDGTDTVYIKRERRETPTVSATDHDHRLGPGAAMAINNGTDGDAAIKDRWTSVASANTPRVSFFETEDINR